MAVVLIKNCANDLEDEAQQELLKALQWTEEETELDSDNETLEYGQELATND